jgi:hypothetical protein
VRRLPPLVQNRDMGRTEDSEGQLPPEEAAELFAAEPEQFVTLRDALAKELQAQGDNEKARSIKRLRKPTLAVWAANRAARQRPDLVEQLLDAGRTMASARSSAVLREASGKRQAAISSLVKAAEDALQKEGHSAATIGDKLTQTLLALSSDEAAASAFTHGMLERELEPELDFGFSMPPGHKDEEVSSAVKDARSKAEELEQRTRELEAEVADLQRLARSARDRLELARMEAERAAKQLDAAEARLSKAKARSDEARAAVKELEAH